MRIEQRSACVLRKGSGSPRGRAQLVALAAAWLGISCGGVGAGADPGSSGTGGSEATGGASTAGASSGGTSSGGTSSGGTSSGDCEADARLCQLGERCVAGTCEPKTRFVVSPDGDGDECADEAPCGLTTARDAVRTIRLSVEDDVVIELLDGDYRLTAPFQLRGDLDSGAEPHRVIYRARAGASPRLTGGVRISGFSLHDAGRNIWAAPVPAGAKGRQLYVNGVRAERTRGMLGAAFVKTDEGYTAPDDSLVSFGNLTDVEVVSLLHWKALRCPIESAAGTAITIAEPCWSAAHVHTGLEIQEPRWLENAYEFLYHPGTFYLDEAAGTVYYIPRGGEDLATAEVVLPTLEVLLDGRGTQTAPLSNLSFEGLRFEYATWLSPSTSVGYASVQAGYHLQDGGWAHQRSTPGNVEFAYAENVSFQGCSFRHLGATGLVFGGGSKNNSVEATIFEDISGGGLRIGDIQPNAGTSGNTVRNSYFTRTGREYFDSVALLVGYADQTLIEQNEVFSVPYSGISVGWGWGAQDPSGAADNRVLNNLVQHVLQQDGMYDGGAIYTLSAQPRSLVSGNYLHDAPQDRADAGMNDGGALYLDQGTRHFEVSGNVAASVPVWFAPQTDVAPFASDNVVTGNFFSTGALDKCVGSAATCTDSELGNAFTDNTVFDLSSWPADAAAVAAHAGLDPALVEALVPATLRVEAEAYASGGEGVGYHDLTPGNEGDAYRNDDVDLYADAHGVVLGYTQTGEWTHYLIEAHLEEDYVFTFSVATETDDCEIALSVDGTLRGSIVLPNTGSYSSFEEVSLSAIGMSRGTHLVRLSFTGGFSLDYFAYTRG